MTRPTAEERVNEYSFATRTGGDAITTYRAVKIAKEHAKAEVEAETAALQQRIEEYQHGLDELCVVLGPLTHPWEIREAVATLKCDYWALADRVEKAERERDEARAEVERLLRSRDEAYTERNALVAALSKVFPASLEQHDPADTSWDPEWLTIVAIELPTGQATWHIHDRERGMFAHLRPRARYAWDGHTTAEKYARLAALAPAPQEGDPA